MALFMKNRGIGGIPNATSITRYARQKAPGNRVMGNGFGAGKKDYIILTVFVVVIVLHCPDQGSSSGIPGPLGGPQSYHRGCDR